MTQKIITVQMTDEFRTCPTCGYRDGFHSMFRQDGETIKWLLICPSCHDAFDIGLTTERNSSSEQAA